jgi:hypothetical protein
VAVASRATAGFTKPAAGRGEVLSPTRRSRLPLAGNH